MADPTPERRRELLRELTQQAIEAGTYGEPAPTVDPFSAQCPACLAAPGEQCYATSSDLPRRHPHRLRGLAAAKRLVRCEHCEGIGWRPEVTDRA